jgi:predicted transcriptional regulator
MIYRSRTEIIENILLVAEPGVPRTRIMYRAFLSFIQLREYLELLTDTGLLEYSEEEKLYRTTERGKYFLKIYKEMTLIMPSIENRVQHVRTEKREKDISWLQIPAKTSP